MEFDKGCIKSYNEKSIEVYFLEVDIQENWYNVQNYLPFLPERMKIEKVEKPVTNLHIKNEYFTSET